MALLHSSGLMIDAYLQWAMLPDVHLFDPRKSSRAVLLVQFGERLSESKIATLSSLKMACGKVYVGYSYATVTVSIEDLNNAIGRLQGLGAIYCELAAPYAQEIVDVTASPPVPQSNGPATVIGIIDDGCPFAHHAYRRNNGSAASVRFIWDQGGTNPSYFMYGTVLNGQIDTILAAATTPPLGVDEDRAYALAALPSLRGMASHGGQVMGHAAGCARLIENRPPLPPLVGRTDFAFVQLPPEALDDPSGLWLKHFGLDGLHAIRIYARDWFIPSTAKVVANLSYGPQTGPHDGSSFMEGAIAEITATARAQNYTFQVVLPSGNSHLLQAHAEINLQGLDTAGHTIDWYVAADSQAYSHLEIWLPPQITLQNVDVQVQSPSGDIVLASASPAGGVVSITTSQVPAPLASTQLQIIVSLSPTARASTDFAPGMSPPTLATPGRWRVTFKAAPGAVGVQGIAHAYLARNDPNMGRPLRGRSGYLDSPNYDDKCGSLPSEQLNPNPPGMGPAEVFARGSMSGITTGAESKVAGGFRLSDNLPAPYSSGGPCRLLAPRNSPDYAYPTEQSRVLAGLLGRGNRSGINMRMSGTSIAAPQLTRRLASPVPPVLNPGPYPLRFGKGRQ